MVRATNAVIETQKTLIAKDECESIKHSPRAVRRSCLQPNLLLEVSGFLECGRSRSWAISAR